MMRTFSAYAVGCTLWLLGVVGSHQALAAILSGRLEGSCRIEALEVCKISFTSDIKHDEATPVIAARVLANGIVVSEYRNDALTPFSDLGIPGRTLGGDSSLAARCGQTYTLELFAQATDESALKSLAITGAIPCPVSVP
jgi:hypothetical protein